MAQKTEDKIIKKKQQWVERTAAVLGVSEGTTRHLLSVPRQQSIRINSLKVDHESVLKQLQDLGWLGIPFAWSQGCYTVEQGLEAIRDSELSRNGQVYIQNAASWLPVLALDVQPHDAVLDMCAAPGGKTSHMAALSANKAHITANDNSRPRLAKLRANLDRLAVENVEYTLLDATQISRKLEGRQFDKILLDAPCSGEGMMTIGNDKDFSSWSVAHIKRLQQLQKKLIVQAWKLLKPGGTLVYSTCTMAPEENEAVVDYLLRHNDDVEVRQFKIDLKNKVPSVLEWNGKKFDERLKFSLRLIPSPEVEAFFVCKLTKLDNATSSV